jgi:hypothetical protein
MSVLSLPFVGSDSALSREAGLIRSLFDARQSVDMTKARRRWALTDACAGASLPNWDGYGAAPVADSTVWHAQRFLAAIPESWPNAEIDVDPDGEVSFEWARDAHWVFTVSVSETGRLSYAGLFGTSRVHGVENLAGTLPRAIVDGLARLFGSGAASVA